METTFYEDIALEAVDFSKFKNTIIDKLRQALLTIIRILRKVTNVNKDEGLRHRIDSLLATAEKNLTKVGNIDTPQDANSMKSAVNSLSSQTDAIVNSVKNKVDPTEKLKEAQDALKKRNERLKSIHETLDNMQKSVNKLATN